MLQIADVVGYLLPCQIDNRSIMIMGAAFIAGFTGDLHEQSLSHAALSMLSVVGRVFHVFKSTSVP